MPDPTADFEALRRGDLVEVRVFGGSIVQRRVWAMDGLGVQVCSEADWQRYIDGIMSEPLYVGWPPDDVLRLAQPEGHQ